MFFYVPNFFYVFSEKMLGLCRFCLVFLKFYVLKNTSSHSQIPKNESKNSRVKILRWTQLLCVKTQNSIYVTIDQAKTKETQHCAVVWLSCDKVSRSQHFNKVVGVLGVRSSNAFYELRKFLVFAWFPFRQSHYYQLLLPLQ